MQQGKLELEAFAGSILGARANQEDASRIWQRSATASDATGCSRPELLLLAADGLGGHASGEVASNTACDAFIAAFEHSNGTTAQRLRASLEAAHGSIAHAISETPTFAGMATTLVAAHIDRHGLSWISVGDTALLRIRSGRLERLNADHSLGSVLDRQAQAGLITDDEARANPKRGALRSALSQAPVTLVDARDEPLVLQPGDLVLLATDGLLTLAETEIVEVAVAKRANGPGAASAKAAVEALLDAVEAQKSNGQDNTTIVALAVHEGPATHLLARTPAVPSVDEPSTVLPSPTPRSSPVGLLVSLALLVGFAAAVLVQWLWGPLPLAPPAERGQLEKKARGAQSLPEKRDTPPNATTPAPEPPSAPTAKSSRPLAEPVRP